MRVELLDPRHDREPDWWERWRQRAGLWANWRYELIRGVAWTGRAPLLLAVLRDRQNVVGVVSAFLSGPPTRARSYVPTRTDRHVGLLDVKAPHNAAQSGWWFDPDLTGPQRADLARAYTRAVRSEMGRRIWGVLWRNVFDDDLTWLTTRHAVVRRARRPMAVLDLPYDDVDGWLAALAPRRRQSLRRQFRLVAGDPAVTVHTGPAPQLVDVAEVNRLYVANVVKHARGRRRPPVRPGTPWLRPIVADEHTRAIVYRHHTGRALGVELAMDHPQWPIAMMWAAVDGVPHLYFDSHAQLVGWAIAAGRPRIVLGPGMLDLKTELGAHRVDHYGVLTAL